MSREHEQLTHTASLMAGAAVGAAALGLARVPAGVLIGSVLGSALVNRSPLARQGPRAAPRAVRVCGLVLLGGAVATQVHAGTLGELLKIWVPLLAAVVLLLVADVLLAWLLVRRYRVDAVTAVLACAPGGFSAISGVADEMGARMGVVLAVHTVRILAVVLLVLPVLIAMARTL
ncbi:hypothetical protein GCM10009844_05740 [Nocardioides koreensis]|uniref:Ammonia monooxygenase n=1 Tax=Nocardioides koreensis TaxID=433651 RepID=A0ABN2Z7Q0_9ACTN